jgi:hypothetical protein
VTKRIRLALVLGYGPFELVVHSSPP